MQAAGSTLQGIVDQVRPVSQLIAEIARSSEQQAQDLRQSIAVFKLTA